MLVVPPKCRAFIIYHSVIMTTNYNTNGLPYGMSHVTEPAFIDAARFLYSQYPGIFKMRIKYSGVKKGCVFIRLSTGPTVRRQKAVRGYSLASAIANIIQIVKKDYDMHSRLKHPERYE